MNLLRKIANLFGSRRKTHEFTPENVDTKPPDDKWSPEKLFAHNLVKNKMTEPQENYTNKDTTRYQDIIIDETINHWDLVKICALNGEKLQIQVGWHSLLKKYFIELDKIGWNRRLSCVKEKFAELRVYFSKDATFINPELLDAISDKYTEASTFPCETCGDFGRIRYGGWDYVACGPHYYSGKREISSDEQYLTTPTGKYRWQNLIEVTTECDYYKQPKFLTLKFNAQDYAYLFTSHQGFGQLVNLIPEKAKHHFNAEIFEKYKSGDFCKVCGLKSLYNRKCEVCEFSEYPHLDENNEVKYSNDDIKYAQLDWFKDGADYFYANNEIYESDTRFIKLFTEEEYNNLTIETDEGENAENIYRECNRAYV